MAESLLIRARQGRLRALRHLHREGLRLSNIFDLPQTGDAADRHARPRAMFEGLHETA